MPVVTVQLWPGKSREQKKNMARAITDAIVSQGAIQAQAIHIVFQEVSRDNWADGGVLADEPK